MADAACAFALLYAEFIRFHSYDAATFQEHSSAMYALAQQFLVRADFQEFQGRMRFVNGSSDPEQLVQIEQARRALQQSRQQHPVVGQAHGAA